MQRISREELAMHFHCPISTAANMLGIGTTALKKICRQYGIPRWPHRKIVALEKKIENCKKLHNRANSRRRQQLEGIRAKAEQELSDLMLGAETEEPLSGNDFEDDSSSAVVTKVPRKKRAPHSQPPQNSSPHNAPAAGGQQVVYASIDPAPSNSYVSSISPHIPPAPGRYPTEIYPADDWNSSMSYRMHESQDDPAIEYHRSNGPRASFDLGSSYNQSNNASTSTGYIDQRPAPRYYESPPMQRSYDMNVNLNLSNSAGSLLDFNPHPPARHYAHDSHPGHLSTFEVPMNLSPSGFEHIAPPTPSPRGIPQHKLRRFGADDSIGRYHAPNMTGTGGAYPYPPGPTLPQLLTTPIQCSTPLYLNHLTVLHTTVT